MRINDGLFRAVVTRPRAVFEIVLITAAMRRIGAAKRQKTGCLQPIVMCASCLALLAFRHGFVVVRVARFLKNQLQSLLEDIIVELLHIYDVLAK